MTNISTSIVVLQLFLMLSSVSNSKAFSRRLLSILPISRPFSSTMTVAVASSTAADSTTAATSYSKLVSKLETITNLERCSAVLSYDQVVFMPEAAAAERGAQMSALASLIHQQKTDPELKTLLENIVAAAESDPSCLEPDAKRLVELERKSLEENERISSELAAKQASLGPAAYAAWVKARQANDFQAFAPMLQDCFSTAMEIAAAKRGDNDISLYTQMLDQFEVGMPQSRIDEMFDEIQSALVPLIEKVLASSYQPSDAPLKGEFNIDKQQKLGKEIVQKLGFDSTKGRIDVSVHPFTSSMSAQDVRITSRFRSDEWAQGLFASIHECGHAIYEQNAGKGTATQIDTALSMGTHESQSLFWERHVGLSKPFWQLALPMLQKEFPEHFGSLSLQDVYEAVNIVQPSLIRVEADELTYPLHVILRYQIEKSVIGGELKVEDIPGRWNKDMKEMLQVDVPDDANGCMQDVHWSHLAFGYFPTYLLGSATAAQLAHYCKKDLPMEELIEKGEFSTIKEWLVEKVHKHGKRYTSLDALLEDQLGEKLNPKYFIDYLTAKYSEIYRL